MDCCEEVGGGLEVACGDASEVLQAVEEALDEVAPAVEVWVYGSNDADIALAGDVGGGARGLDGLGDRAAEVAAIGDHIAAEMERANQFGCGCLVGRLTWGENEADWPAATVDHGMDLGSQSPTGATDGVIRAPFLPPAACWWARTIELSIKCRLSGDISLSRLKMRSQTPCLAHRLYRL